MWDETKYSVRTKCIFAEAIPRVMIEAFAVEVLNELVATSCGLIPRGIYRVQTLGIQRTLHWGQLDSLPASNVNRMTPLPHTSIGSAA